MASPEPWPASRPASAGRASGVRVVDGVGVAVQQVDDHPAVVGEAHGGKGDDTFTPPSTVSTVPVVKLDASVAR